MFSVKLKPLPSNKCTLVPASMKGIRLPLTNAKMSKCSSPLLTPHSLDLCFSKQVTGKVIPQSHQSNQLQFTFTGNCHDAHYQHSVYENRVNTSYIHTLQERDRDRDKGWGKTGQKAIRSYVLVLHQPADYKLGAFGASTT